ncbi:polysaccharide deacetylase family protein [Halobacteriovorax sp.]|uniref:polysaccharide deacetylase family protein n=1 Tax=Halobacteriovorax sp. TaxID=2020862 RepID=UPI003567470C
MRKIKIFIFKILKIVGVFNLTLFLTRKKLRIFCYHGLSYEDEHLFIPSLFIAQDTFLRRMKILKKYNINVLKLNDAHEKNIRAEINKPSAVLTFDDGFISTFELALPILEEYSYDSTIYITSYYQKYQNPIFRLAVRYFFWKKKPTRELVKKLDLPVKNHKMWEIIKYGETELKENERQELLEKIRITFGVEISKNLESKFMKLDTNKNILEAYKNGVDIQLHTHRHRLPIEREQCEKEILENKAYLKELLGVELDHFCYPSGIWSPEHLPILKDLGVKTATTCDPALINPSTDPLAYPRFLDSDEKTDIEFEADLCGITHILVVLKELVGINTKTTTY